MRSTTKALEALEAADPAGARAAFGVGEDALTFSADFWYMVADSAAMAVQYGMKADLCGPLVAAAARGPDADLVAAFANVTATLWGPNFAADCFYDTNCLSNAALASTRWQPTARSWRWQKCSQLAYFQVAPEDAPLRSSRVTLQYHLDQCDAAFGDRVTDPQSAVAAWNAKTGGSSPESDVNTFFSNGSDDPWQTASVSPTTDDSRVRPAQLAVCDTCGHCGDLAAPSPDDPPNLAAQRAAFAAHLDAWLADATRGPP